MATSRLLTCGTGNQKSIPSLFRRLLYVWWIFCYRLHATYLSITLCVISSDPSYTLLILLAALSNLLLNLSVEILISVTNV